MLDAEEELQKVKRRDKEVDKVSKAMKTLRRENHFAEKLHASMGGGV